MRCKADKLAAFTCMNPAVHDGYCAGHYEFLFKGMTNSQRMKEKRHLNGIIKEKERDALRAKQTQDAAAPAEADKTADSPA